MVVVAVAVAVVPVVVIVAVVAVRQQVRRRRRQRLGLVRHSLSVDFKRNEFISLVVNDRKWRRKESQMFFY